MSHHEEDDYEEDESLYEIEPDMSTDTVVIIDGIPAGVLDAKQKKLKAFLLKTVSHLGPVVEDGVHVALDEKGSTAGYAFVEYEHGQSASRACLPSTAGGLNNHKFDRRHVLRVSPFGDLDKYAEVPDEYTPPPHREYEPKEFLQDWLLDTKARDQFAIKAGDSTEIYWNDTTQAPPLVRQKNMWTESRLHWSPKGTYLVTFHRQGIALWGGPSWNKMARFAHQFVIECAFSPNERFMVTFNDQVSEDRRDGNTIIFWDLRTGAKLRGFPHVKANVWPFFRWSFDDKFFATIGTDSISVYEAPAMRLLDKKAVEVLGVQDFAWSPSDAILAYWTPEKGNSPACITLMEMPSRKIIRKKNIFNVADCKLHWQGKGDYLCVKVDRLTKSKKTMFTNFEFFRIRETDIPVETLEQKEPIIAFAWEPSGPRCAIIYGTGPKATVEFFSMAGGKLDSVNKIEKCLANHLYWSPRGTNIVLAGLKNLNGTLMFYDVANGVEYKSDEHFMCTDVEWDPTGRYVITHVSCLHHAMENGYRIWSFQGRIIHQVAREKSWEIHWRPRPPTLLTKEELKSIKANLKEYSTRYDQEDELLRNTALDEVKAERARIRLEFKNFVLERRARWQAEADLRTELIGPGEGDDAYEMVEEVREEVIETTEEIQKM